MKCLIPLFIALISLSCSDKNDRRESITYLQLLNELNDPSTLASPPKGKASIISTYDVTGANKDWARWPPAAPDGLVDIANLKGPGCITRIWMTSLRPKSWQFFIDGETTPRLKLTNEELFGGKSPFIKPLANLVSSGHYSYIPISYQHSIRIALEVDDTMKSRASFWHLNYIQYDKGTTVEAFPASFTADQQTALDTLAAHWSNPERLLSEAVAGCSDQESIVLQPNSTNTWLDVSGGNTLDAFWLKLEAPATINEHQRALLLRELVLDIYWDDSAVPSVTTPLGDFFGNALHYRSYASLASGYQDGVFISRFTMPFTKSARAVIRNQSPFKLTLHSGIKLLDEAPKTPNYFHAYWNAGINEGRPFGSQPYEVLRDKGAGHYVGCYLNVIGMDGTWSLLESDETVRINQEVNPSWNGTGLEDYFNGAWYYKGIFDLPLHGLLDKSGTRTAQYRIHLGDRVRYEDGFSFNFEFGYDQRYGANVSRGYLSSTAFYYKPTISREPRILPDALRFPPVDPYYEQGFMAGLFELERIGHYQEARERCLAFTKHYAKSPNAAIMALRAVAYGAHIEGSQPVGAAYAEMLRRPQTSANRQLHHLHWREQSADHYLIGLNPNGASTVFLDGNLIGQADEPHKFPVFRQTLSPGKHTLTVEVKPADLDPWFSLCLSGKNFQLRSDETWETTATKPTDWPIGKDPNTGWQKLVRKPGGGDMLPRDVYWHCQANAYVNFQSGQQLIRPWYNFEGEQKKAKVYLRKTFTIPAPITP